MSGDLAISCGAWQRSLAAGDRVTFGRDGSCDLQLDAADRGISRLAGEVVGEAGTWWVINRSSKRALHVVDDAGLSIPLPVARQGWPSPRRAVTPPQMTILIPGDIWTHELRMTLDDSSVSAAAVAPHDPVSTSTQLRELTENRRLALTALLSGYLQPFPRYDPRPLSYAAAAALLDLPPSTVRKRVEMVRNELTEAGVAGLDGDDAPRRLAEWLLSTRVIVPEDLAWMHEVVASGNVAGD